MPSDLLFGHARRPLLANYCLAAGCAVLAVLARALVDLAAPGIAYLVILLPAVVVAGVFLGTGPAIFTATLALVTICGVFVPGPLFRAPFPTSTQMDVLSFLPACGAVLWATHALRRREAALQAALEARSILMREADHRIKNSLQLVAAILRLQAGRSEAPEAREALNAANARVTAVANAHLALQRSPDLKTMELGKLLDELSSRITVLNPDVSLTCRVEPDIWLDTDQALPIGLIVSEVLTNALKHAFPPGTTGVVSLACGLSGDHLEVVIADGGAGLPATPVRPGLGTTVMTALSKQIGAAVMTQTEPGQGTTVTLTLPFRPQPSDGMRSGYAPAGGISRAAQGAG